MTPFGTDLMTELRRPFCTQGPMGRRAMGGTALVCLAAVGVLAVSGSVFGVPHALDVWLLAPLTNNMSSIFDPFRMLVLVAAASSLVVILAADERISFPLTRGLWALAKQGVPGTNGQLVGLAIFYSPFLLAAFIFDMLAIVFVGVLASGAAALSLGSCLALCCVPMRKGFFP